MPSVGDGYVMGLNTIASLRSRVVCDVDKVTLRYDFIFAFCVTDGVAVNVPK